MKISSEGDSVYFVSRSEESTPSSSCLGAFAFERSIVRTASSRDTGNPRTSQ